MSTNSKAKRDAAKKKQPKTTSKRATPSIQAHAHLRLVDGQITASAAKQDADWLLVMDGRIAARTESAGMVLAMLAHLANLHRARGTAVELDYSTALGDAATAEAAALDKTLEQYLQLLEQERIEHAERKQAQASDSAERSKPH